MLALWNWWKPIARNWTKILSRIWNCLATVLMMHLDNFDACCQTISTIWKLDLNASATFKIHFCIWLIRFGLILLNMQLLNIVKIVLVSAYRLVAFDFVECLWDNLGALRFSEAKCFKCSCSQLAIYGEMWKTLSRLSKHEDMYIIVYSAFQTLQNPFQHLLKCLFVWFENYI